MTHPNAVSYYTANDLCLANLSLRSKLWILTEYTTRWKDGLEFISLVSSCSILQTSHSMTLMEGCCYLDSFSLLFWAWYLQPSHRLCDLHHILSTNSFFVCLFVSTRAFLLFTSNVSHTDTLPFSSTFHWVFISILNPVH